MTSIIWFLLSRWHPFRCTRTKIRDRISQWKYDFQSFISKRSKIVIYRRCNTKSVDMCTREMYAGFQESYERKSKINRCDHRKYELHNITLARVSYPYYLGESWQESSTWGISVLPRNALYRQSSYLQYFLLLTSHN